MADKPRTRRVAIRKFSCPNHPDGPPTLPADGVEREELTFVEAYGEEAARDLNDRLGACDWIQTFGLCCLGHGWSTVGYEEVEVSAYEGMLIELGARWQAEYAARNVLLAELARGGGAGTEGSVTIPIVTSESKGEA